MCFSSPHSDEEQRRSPTNYENIDVQTSPNDEHTPSLSNEDHKSHNVKPNKSNEQLELKVYTDSKSNVPESSVADYENKQLEIVITGIDNKTDKKNKSANNTNPSNDNQENELQKNKQLEMEVTEFANEDDIQDNKSDSSSSSDFENEALNKSADINTSQDSVMNITDCDNSVVTETTTNEVTKLNKEPLISKVLESKITSKKTSSPKQAQKKLEIEKQREEKRKEHEKKKQELLEEKLKVKQEKEKLKLEKQEQKRKEIEEKLKEKEEKKKKEREEKEQKRKEKEEKIEQKRKEKEEKNEQKRKEQEEKNKEKQKLEEKKQKAATAFANFFTKKSENMVDEKKSEDDMSLTFMPFEVKSDMRLAPIFRTRLTDSQKEYLNTALQKQNNKLYLYELKKGKKIGKDGKTWPFEESEDSDDVVVVEDINPGESIEEQSQNSCKLRAKFLKFSGNRRPPYFGTWRKKSKFIKPRKPLAIDKEHFDYEYDSDEDWEEDDDIGESLRGSDDEDKENDSDNEYEVDNDFFVPHGHLSDDEVNDEEGVDISPEAHKAKLKLLKKEFEEEMQGKTQKIKPRVIGCIWYKEQNNVDNAIHEFLKPFSIISNGPIVIRKRNEFVIQTPVRNVLPGKPLDVDLIPDFLKVIHGNTNNSNKVITEFLNCLRLKNSNVEVSKASLKKQWRQFADWIRCPEEGPMLNKYCWYVRNEVKEEYNIDLALPNK